MGCIRPYSLSTTCSYKLHFTPFTKSWKKVCIFPRTFIFTDDLFAFQCIHMTIMICWQINGRLITRGCTVSLILCPQALPFSLSLPVYFILFLPALSLSNSWLESLFTSYFFGICVCNFFSRCDMLFTLIPSIFIPLDQRLGNEWPWKDLIWSLKILDFRLNCECLAEKYVALSRGWCFTSAHFRCFLNQSKSSP